MSILLLILKWIGILLGILLLLVLLLITLALCVPVRYRISGCNKDTFQYSFKISFLLSIVSVKKKKESQQIVFSVFHIPIKKIGANKKKRTKSTPDNTTKEESFETEKKEKEIKQDKPVLSVQEKKNKKKKRRKRKGKKKNFSFQKISSIMKCIKQNKKILKRLFGEIKALLLYLAPKKVKGEFLFGTGDPSTTGLFTGFISLFPVVYQDGFFVRPDFEEKKLEADFSAKGRMRLLYFLRLFFRLYRDRELKRMWKQIHRLKKEAL